MHEEECIYSGHANTLGNQTADVILNVCDGLVNMIFFHHVVRQRHFLTNLTLFNPTGMSFA